MVLPSLSLILGSRSTEGANVEAVAIIIEGVVEHVRDLVELELVGGRGEAAVEPVAGVEGAEEGGGHFEDLEGLARV